MITLRWRFLIDWRKLRLGMFSIVPRCKKGGSITEGLVVLLPRGVFHQVGRKSIWPGGFFLFPARVGTLGYEFGFWRAFRGKKARTRLPGDVSVPSPLFLCLSLYVVLSVCFSTV